MSESAFYTTPLTLPEFSLPLRVYIEDTDAGGIVYYVNYLKFMERARTELMRSLGYDKPAMFGEDRLMVVHSANVNYRRAARLDDRLTATASVSKLARSYIVFHQEIHRDGELLCEADIKVACVLRSNMRPVALPGDVKSSIMDFLASR